MEHPYSLNEIGLTPRKSARPVAPEFLSAALTGLPPLPKIKGVELLTPGDPRYKEYVPGCNLRTIVWPALRAVCKSAEALPPLLDWILTNKISFAVRSGGHSYEGFSQSPWIVIDTRTLNRISFDAERQLVTVGAGAALGDVYKFLKPYGLAFVAGSCPTVGVAGHTLGGGFGLLGRTHGLTADNLESVTLIDANGKFLRADDQSNTDLFWACKGGGGGSFGIATEFCFRVHGIDQVAVFGVSWLPCRNSAVELFEAWQQWAPVAPEDINCILKVGHDSHGALKLRCVGQSTSSEASLRCELARIINVAKPSTKLAIRKLSFFEAVDHFSGVGGWDYRPIYFKAKSDYVVSGLSKQGITALIDKIAEVPHVIALCDAYGGGISRIPTDATAFPHRDRATYCIQYYSEWLRDADSVERLGNVVDVYQAMRPYVSGSSYVNYCDLDIQDWAAAYWGPNLSRLRAVKSRSDPENVFVHAQSVPSASQSRSARNPNPA